MLHRMYISYMYMYIFDERGMMCTCIYCVYTVNYLLLWSMIVELGYNFDMAKLMVVIACCRNKWTQKTNRDIKISIHVHAGGFRMEVTCIFRSTKTHGCLIITYVSALLKYYEWMYCYVKIRYLVLCLFLSDSKKWLE